MTHNLNLKDYDLGKFEEQEFYNKIKWGEFCETAPKTIFVKNTSGLELPITQLVFQADEEPVVKQLFKDGTLPKVAELQASQLGGRPCQWDKNPLYRIMKEVASGKPLPNNKGFTTTILLSENIPVGVGQLENYLLEDKIFRYFLEFLHPHDYNNFKGDPERVQKFFKNLFGNLFTPDIKMAGISGVVVHPEFRNTNLAKDIYSPLLELIKKFTTPLLISGVRSGNVIPGLIKHNGLAQFFLNNVFLGKNANDLFATFPRIAYPNTPLGHALFTAVEEKAEKHKALSKDLVMSEAHYPDPERTLPSDVRFYKSRFGTNFIKYWQNYSLKSKTTFYGLTPNLWFYRLFNKKGVSVPLRVLSHKNISEAFNEMKASGALLLVGLLTTLGLVNTLKQWYYDRYN